MEYRGDAMSDIEYLKQVGIEFPVDLEFTKTDWHDFYVTLSKFKIRVMQRHNIDPTALIHPKSGKIIPGTGKRSERNG
jgi:hypothetical protein